ncbi:hypothetical protein [Jiella sp. M17.18]|uniref:hypothetical protein n=1 Tax=Jiella sp. M17.18 TaxID=3234247 RepID=UPI0034DF7637
MDDLRTEELDGFLQPLPDGQVTPEHRAWMNEQIDRTLAKKAQGEMTYTSLDQVRRTFDVDAS